MKIPSKPRYWKSIEKASYFLESQNLDKFPYDLFAVCSKNDWTVLPYSQLAKQEGVDVPRICEAFQSDEGASCLKNGRYYIFYNDEVPNYQRIRFTLIHEIGHIVLGHHAFSETCLRNSLTEDEYDVLEKETNAFARNALVPAPLVREIGFSHHEDIADYFNISHTVAQARLNLMATDLYYWALAH